MSSHPFYRFTVESKFPFPMDMLRYDECWPEDSVTANRMAASHEQQGRADPLTYVLNTRSRGGPTSARWESFMFKVVNVEEMVW